MGSTACTARDPRQHFCACHLHSWSARELSHEHSNRDEFWGSTKAIAHVLRCKGFNVHSSLLATSNFDQHFNRDSLIRQLKLFFRALPQWSMAKVAYVGQLDEELSHKQQVEGLHSGDKGLPNCSASKFLLPPHVLTTCSGNPGLAMQASQGRGHQKAHGTSDGAQFPLQMTIG